MENSIFIAKLIGPIILVAGLVGLLNTKAVQDVGRSFLANQAMIFLGGILALLGGLVLVNVHNVWVADWPVIITLLGWLSVVGGVLRMGLPDFIVSLGQKMIAKPEILKVSGIIQIGLGAFLTYKGYL